MKLLKDWVQIEFEEVYRNGIYRPHAEGEFLPARVKRVGTQVKHLSPDDKVFVKNFKPLGWVNGEDLVLTREGNVRATIE